MKRFLVAAAAALLLSQALPGTARAFSVKDVVTMHQDGIPDSLIMAKIRHSGTTFRLDAKDLHVLKEAGVSNDVVLAMLRTEDSRDYGDDDYYDYHGPHYVPWWYVSFDFHPYYYRPYYRPYYRAYVPYYGHGGFPYRGYGFGGRRYR